MGWTSARNNETMFAVSSGFTLALKVPETGTGVALSSASVKPEPPGGRTTGILPASSVGNFALTVDNVVSVAAPVGSGKLDANTGTALARN
jgi:hypothetical protein